MISSRDISSLKVSSDRSCYFALKEFSIHALSPKKRGQRFIRLNKEKNIPIHLDLGGEGRYPDAININPNAYTSTTGEPGEKIPFWVKGRSDDIPISSSSVDKVTIENAPINLNTIDEMLRVLRPRGDIYLSHPKDYAKEAHQLIIDSFPEHHVIQEDLEYNTVTKIIYRISK
jgi:hypothetical protein